MAGIIAIYGLVVAALISNDIKPAPNYNLFKFVMFSFWNNCWISIAEKIQLRYHLIYDLFFLKMNLDLMV